MRISDPAALIRVMIYKEQNTVCVICFSFCCLPPCIWARDAMAQLSTLVSLVLVLTAAGALVALFLGGFALGNAGKNSVQEAALAAQLAALTARVDALTTALDHDEEALAALSDEVDELMNNVSSSSAGEERFIETVLTTLDQPPSYNGVPIQFDYFYTKNGSRLRVEVSLPVGYLRTAATATFQSGDHLFDAEGVLPAWACRLDTRGSEILDFSWKRATFGNFFRTNDYGDEEHIDQMDLDNAPVGQGYWQCHEDNYTSFAELEVYLGTNECNSYNTTACFPDYIGPLITVLTYQPDIDAWDAHYDAAA